MESKGSLKLTIIYAMIQGMALKQMNKLRAIKREAVPFMRRIDNSVGVALTDEVLLIQSASTAAEARAGERKGTAEFVEGSGAGTETAGATMEEGRSGAAP